MLFQRRPRTNRRRTRLEEVFTDAKRAEAAVGWSLAVYVVLWTLYGTIAKSPQGLHPDMTEIVAWSRDLAFGYLKHPPFAAALVRGWFALLPVGDWSYYLLAMLMPGLALWFAWRLSADYLPLEKRVFGLALLTLVPFYNFHALKFNVNTVLMPLWAATALCFLRSLRQGGVLWPALAGVAAAAAMLGKYWSVFLIGGLVLAALIDARRAAYFRSPAPWITVVTGLIVLSPHLVWLVQHDFAPFTYAETIHGAKPVGGAALSALGYLAGALGYVAVPLVVVATLTRPTRALVTDMAWPADAERRRVAAAFWGPLLLPMLGAVAGRTEITSLWSMSAFTLLPVLLLSPEAVTVRAIDLRRLLVIAMAFPIAMVIVSPGIAYLGQRRGPPPATAQASVLAAQVERLWRQATLFRPLRFVGGDRDLAYGVVTYAPDRPRALPGLPAPSHAELARDGMVLVCATEDSACRDQAAKQATGFAGTQTVISNIARGFLGRLGKLQSYTIVIVPPQR